MEVHDEDVILLRQTDPAPSQQASGRTNPLRSLRIIPPSFRQPEPTWAASIQAAGAKVVSEFQEDPSQEAEMEAVPVPMGSLLEAVPGRFLPSYAV